MKSKVSVIVPVYNVESYLDECISSILRQTYSNLEILLVDDGSTDKSGELCDNYVTSDSRIRVIHKENGGLSDARNCGLYAASGEYVLFVDSDDWIADEMVEILLAVIQSENADISACHYIAFEDSSRPKQLKKYGVKRVMTGYDCLKFIWIDKQTEIGFVAWNKLYRRDLFLKNQIEYPFGRIHEDMFTTHKLIYSAEKIVETDAVLYFYRKRNGSIMKSSYSKRKCIDALDADLLQIQDYAQWGEYSFLPAVVSRALKNMILSYSHLAQIEECQDRVFCKEYIMKEYRQTWELYSKYISSKPRRIVFATFQYAPVLISKLIDSLQ